MRVPSSLSSLSSSLSGISLLRNLGAQALERPREPRLDGSSRATQDRGRLLFGEPQEVAAADSPPRFLAQAAQGLEQLFPPLRRENRTLGGGRAILRRAFPRRAGTDRRDGRPPCAGFWPRWRLWRAARA